MAFTKLGSLAFRVTQREPLLERLTAHRSKAFLTLCSNQSTVGAKKEEEDELDQPIVYSASEAAKWNPRAARLEQDIPWFQPLWVLGSVGAILIYFCILREENDIDERLSWDLKDHFHGEARAKLEASQRIPFEYASRRNYTPTQKDIS